MPDYFDSSLGHWSRRALALPAVSHCSIGRTWRPGVRGRSFHLGR